MLSRPQVFRSVGQIRLPIVAQHLTPTPSYKSVARDVATLAMATQVPSIKLSSGHVLPLLGLGTSGLSGEKATQATDSALSLGYRVLPALSRQPPKATMYLQGPTSRYRELSRCCVTDLASLRARLQYTISCKSARPPSCFLSGSLIY